jgi:hypothetical protein
MERIIPGFSGNDLIMVRNVAPADLSAAHNTESYMNLRINGQYQQNPVSNFVWSNIKDPENPNEPDAITFSKNIIENPDLFIGTLNTDFHTLDNLKREAAVVNPPRLKIREWT